jgi:hypothetical protein
MGVLGGWTRHPEIRLQVSDKQIADKINFPLLSYLRTTGCL